MALKAEGAWLAVAWPIRGAKYHRAETLLGCVTFTERGATQMRSLDFSRYVLSGVAAAAMLAGCGGSQPPIGAPGAMPQTAAIATQDHKDYDVRGPLLYVTDLTENVVTVYHADAKDPTPFATISAGLNAPAGDCIDSHGTLYVTNQPSDGPGWVSEYSLGTSKPTLIIKKGMDTPAFCAIDSNGNLWVTNIGGANVTEYLYGSKKPDTVITDGVPHPVGLAIDSSDNLYVANRLQSSNVVVYPPGRNIPSRTITDGVTSPVGIAVDASGVLYVANITEANVEEYSQGGYTPFKTITKGLITPAPVIVNKKGWLYVANNEQGVVLEFRPGAVIPSKRQVSNGVKAPNGLAIYPAVLP
jgi:hypothetical protein